MKKGLVLLVMLLLISGCGKEKVTCKYKDDSKTYKNERVVVATFEKDSLYSFKSTILEEHTEEESANNSYIYYQDLYNNYNENNVISISLFISFRYIKRWIFSGLFFFCFKWLLSSYIRI